MSSSAASPPPRVLPARIAPPLAGGTGWLDSPPLTPEALRGRVVLYVFWTYTCINWLRTLPYVRACAARYRDHGLVVVGVHTPEFEFEQDIDNVRPAVRSHRLDFPVVLDSDYAIWGAFDNDYWPAFYLADDRGAIRYAQFGEGRYAEGERAVKQLLRAAGAQGIDDDLVSVAGTGDEAPADWAELESIETYFGYARAEGFAADGRLEPDRSHRYAGLPRLRRNSWTLSGAWTARRDRIVAEEPGAAIAIRFHARDLHLVLAPAGDGRPVPFRVTLDGRAPGDAAGTDIDASGAGRLREPRMYQLVRQPHPIVDRTAEITFPDGAAAAFVVTFG